MGDTTSSTYALFDELCGPRPMLCDAIGLHDANPAGYCRDCGKLLSLDDPVAGTCLLHELPGSRSHQVRPSDRMSFWRARR